MFLAAAIEKNIYYINTNEIPGELPCESIFSCAFFFLYNKQFINIEINCLLDNK